MRRLSQIFQAYQTRRYTHLIDNPLYYEHKYVQNIHVMSEYLFLVLKQNPNMTAPQIAHTVTNLWKELSSEERGYFRDLARDEKSDCDIDKLKTKEKNAVDTNKDKNRLLKALEKMKRMNYEKKENLVMRTTVPLDIDMKKVTKKFLNKYVLEIITNF